MSTLNPYHAQMITRLYRALIGYKGTYNQAADFIRMDEVSKIKFYADNVLPRLKAEDFPESHTEAADACIQAYIKEMIYSK